VRGINLHHVGVGVVVVAVAGAIAFQVWPRPHPDNAEAANQATSPTSSQQQPSPSAPAATSPSPQTSSAPASDPYGVIKQRAVKIMQAYYWLDPNDTSATRRARITALVPLSTMAVPNFGVGKTSCQDRARLTHQLNERATVYTDQISTQPVGGPDTLYMLVPGKVQQYTADKKPYPGTDNCPSSEPFTATFQWQKHGSGWTIVHFGNPGDVP
jgi:hypothetical protein